MRSMGIERCAAGTVALMTLVAMSSSLASAGDWPSFRGPNGDGAARQTGVFPESGGVGLKVAWKKKIGSGYSGVTVADGHVITCFSDGAYDVAVSHDEATGRRQWRFEIGPTYKGHDGSHDGPIATTAIAGDRVFGLGARGRLFALDVKTGREIWSTDLVEDHKAARPHYGFGTSPLVMDGVLVVQIGAKDAAVAGFDTATGKKLWTAGADSVGYQSPIPYELDGRKHIVAAGAKQLHGIDPKDGKIVWLGEHGGGPGGISLVPVPAGPRRLFLNNKQHTSTLVSLVAGSDAIEIKPVWEDRSIHNTYNIPVYHDGHLYAYSSRFLTCVDAETGKSVWKSRQPGDGFLMLVDGHLVIITKAGELHVVKATPDGYRHRASLKLFEDLAWTNPSFANGRIYVRSLGEIARVDIRAAAAVAMAKPADRDLAGTRFGRFLESLDAATDKSEEIDRFLKTQKQFPILEGDDRIHFVYRGSGKDLAVAGDMFGARQERPMNRVDGTDLFYYSMRLEPDARVNYLFMRDYEEIIDPRNDRKTSTTLLTKEMEMSFSGAEFEMSWTAMPRWKKPAHLETPSESRRGHIAKHELDSALLKTKHEIRVYLPHGYDADGKTRYPVVYVHGGQGAEERGHYAKSLDNLIGRSVAPLIVVFIRQAAGMGQYPLFADMVADEVVKFVDDKYRTVAKPESRAVVGSGFPAIEAVYTAFKRPETFGKAAIQSIFLMEMMRGGLDPMIEAHSGKPLEFYVDWGKYDMRNPHEAWDLGKSSREFAALLRSKGHRVTGGEAHDGTGWSSWRNRNDAVFEALFPLKGGRTGS